MSIMLFGIDGYSFDSLNVLSWKFSGEILDGEGTGRMSDWEMFREPKGLIKNIEMEIAMPRNDNPDFIKLLAILDSFGEVDFRTVTFLSPTVNITQQMYAGTYNMEAVAIREINKNGEEKIVSHWKPLRVKFIAQKPMG